MNLVQHLIALREYYTEELDRTSDLHEQYQWIDHIEEVRQIIRSIK